MGRFWQTLLLARWRPIFAWIPVETIVKTRQQDYYDAIAKSDAADESTTFIVFMLHCLLESLNEFKVTDKVTDKVANKTLSNNEQKILKLIENDSYITVGKMHSITGLSESGIKKILVSLRKKDVLERVGANKNGQWRIKDNSVLS